MIRPKDMCVLPCFCEQAQPFTAESIANACETEILKSSKPFLSNISIIKKKNKNIDYRRFFDPRYHCDNELLIEGQSLITDGLSVVKAANKEQNFVAARSTLGGIFHTLQVFSYKPFHVFLILNYA